MSRNRLRRIFAGVLSGGGGASVLTYKQKMLNTFAGDFVSYLPLDETAGATTALDASGNGCTGAATSVTFGGTGIGDGGTSATFNGTSSFINWYTAALAALYNPNEFTLCAWIKRSTTTAKTVIMLEDVDTFGININQIVTSGNMAFKRREPAGGDSQISVACDTNFHNYIWEVSLLAGTIEVYKDGSAAGTETPLEEISNVLNSGRARIGRSGASSYWAGNLAHIMLINRVLTPSERTAINTI